MRETDTREPLPPGLPRLGPAGGWRAALLAAALAAAVSLAVFWVALPRLGEQATMAVQWGAGFATFAVAYQRLRDDHPSRASWRITAAGWLMAALAVGGLRWLFTP